MMVAKAGSSTAPVLPGPCLGLAVQLLVHSYTAHRQVGAEGGAGWALGACQLMARCAQRSTSAVL